jgi:hypothetical protein
MLFFLSLPGVAPMLSSRAPALSSRMPAPPRSADPAHRDIDR